MKTYRYRKMIPTGIPILANKQSVTVKGGGAGEMVLCASDLSLLHPKRILRAAKALAKPLSPVKVCMLSSSGRCGIAEYTATLMEHLPGWVNRVRVDTFGAVSDKADLLHIQYEPGLWPDKGALDATFRHFPGKKVITAHYYDEWLKKHAKLFDLIIVHDERFGYRKNHRYIVQGCPVYPPKGKLELKSRFGVSGKIVLASFGFYMDWKKLEIMFEHLAPYLSLNPNLHLFWLHSIHPKAEGYGRNARSRVNMMIRRCGIDSRVTVSDDFLSNDAINDYLQAADLGFLWSSLADSTGSSAVSKQYVAARCPLIVSDISHYRDLDYGVVRVSPAATIQEFIYRMLALAVDTEQLQFLQAGQSHNYSLINYERVSKMHAGIYWELVHGS